MTDSISLTRRAGSMIWESIKAVLPFLFFYLFVLWVYHTDGFEAAVLVGLGFILLEVYND